MIARIALLALVVVVAYFAFTGIQGHAGITAFLGAVFGVVASSLFVLFVESWRRPSIKIEIENPHPVSGDGRKWLRVIVRNADTPWFIRPFMDRQPALLTSARIVFLTVDKHILFNAAEIMQGRWSNTPEPVKAQLINTQQGIAVATIRDPTTVRNTVDIPPRGHEVLDVVMRPEGSEDCMGWHNEIINNPSPKQSFNLPRGRFHALVVVETGGRRFSKLVRIVNDREIDQFRLEDADDERKRLPPRTPLVLGS